MRYTKVAVTLHWLMALCIVVQLISGLWMSDAIHEAATRALAFRVYQWHKSLGLCVLVLALVRLGWRLTHKAPPLPAGMSRFEHLAAHATHLLFYAAMILIPLLGWAMVSSSPFGLPTYIFGWFEWPHIGFLTHVADKKATSDNFAMLHQFASYGLIALLALHLLAVLKHQFIMKDGLLRRMTY